MPSTRALIHAPWSASKVATALRCPRLFHFKYIEKLKEPEVMPETRIGKSIHKALELVLMGTPISEAKQKVRDELPSEIEQARFDNLGIGIEPFATRIQQFRRRRRVARQLVEYSLAIREDDFEFVNVGTKSTITMVVLAMDISRYTSPERDELCPWDYGGKPTSRQKMIEELSQGCARFSFDDTTRFVELKDG